MPFSSLTDPVDLARADGALNAAWAELQWMTPEPLGERERTKAGVHHRSARRCA